MPKSLRELGSWATFKDCKSLCEIKICENVKGRKSSFYREMAETSGSGVPQSNTLNIASDVNATAKRYCRIRLWVPAGSAFRQL
ncbi:MAG: hypothetical protein IJ673_05340, partial [Treponema sp.]|nr:hypothetical protein [Treponema sp.]